jgi:N-methylhydantoinase A
MSRLEEPGGDGLVQGGARGEAADGSRWRLGVDIGGTFTDLALVNEATGEIAVVKVPTTPRDFGDGVIGALRTAIDAHQIRPDRVSLLAHATTVVTNALLEGRGARTALVTTRGMRDVLELRRSARATLYDLNQDPPAVLVPRRLRLEVTERVDAQGAVVESLRMEDVEAAVAAIRAAGVDAVSVCLLYSFLNDAHERLVGERLREALPGVPVFLSSEVLPEIREFERTSTTAVCAYVGPILASYLGRLQSATAGLGLPDLHVMGSSGGLFRVEEALRMPAMVVESGPAAGVIAAALLGRQVGRDNLISFDMGGTTAKASLIEHGAIKTTAEYEVGGDRHVGRWLHGTGHPVRVPVIDLAEVSAGGGSIAWIDAGGSLRLGPRSAGAEPGPACYGQGGEQPTVTDADVVLGYLHPEYLLGGALRVHADRGRAAIERHVAGPLGISAIEAAAGMLDVVTASMAAALRIVSVERGYDPREFALVAFGGAGPVHAARLAEELAIGEVIIPPIPGGFSALGLVASDLRRDYVRTFYTTLDTADVPALAAAYRALEAAARAMLERAEVPAARRELARAADLRYPRQAYELTVPVPEGPLTAESLRRLAMDFHDKHRMTYGHASGDEPVQLVNIRVSAVGRLDALDLGRAAAGPARGKSATRPVYFKETGLAACDVVPRELLGPGSERPGPVVVESMDTTVVVPPGWRLRVDPRGFILLEALCHA